jgi:hypothetical protein
MYICDIIETLIAIHIFFVENIFQTLVAVHIYDIYYYAFSFYGDHLPNLIRIQYKMFHIVGYFVSVSFH